MGGAVRAAPVQAEWETVARSIRPSPFADKPSHWEVAAFPGKFSPRIEQVFGDGEVILRTVQAQPELQPQNSLLKIVLIFYGSSAMLLKDRMKDKIVDHSHKAL